MDEAENPPLNAQIDPLSRLRVRLERSGRVSAATYSSYSSVGQRFLDACARSGVPFDPDHKRDLYRARDEFLATVTRAHMSRHPGTRSGNVGTLSRYSTALRSLFLANDIPVGDDWPEYRASPPRDLALSTSEATAMLASASIAVGVADSGPKARAAERDHLLLSTLLLSGVRDCELLGLRPSDLDTTPGAEALTVVPKGGGTRRVEVDFRDLFGAGPLMPLLTAYVRERGVGSAEPIFDVTARTVARAVKEFARKVGAREADRISPHVLRHTYATELQRRGVELKWVAINLGHKMPGVTGSVYSHFTHDEIRAALGRREDVRNL